MEDISNEGASGRLQHLVVCGSGLAARMTVAALSLQVPAHIRVTWLKVPGTGQHDVLYGHHAPPSAYDFNLACGLDERELLLAGAASFSFGTSYSDWGGERRAWVQAFHAPFPILNGVLFYHYLLRQGTFDLSPYLVSAEAATRGVFAHPPEDTRLPLSRAEYGYNFDPELYGARFESLVPPSANRIVSPIARVHKDGERIASIELSDGRPLTADLYIDCMGPETVLAEPLAAGRQLGVLSSRTPMDEGGPKPARILTAGLYGWSADTPVVTENLRLTVFDRDSRDLALQAHGAPSAKEACTSFGYRETAWRGNCVAIGHAAGVIEPVTTAPFLLLQRDIERLLTLLPASTSLAIERREYNRQYAEDYRNAALFNRALFVTTPPEGRYWEAAVATPIDERLAAKLEQFHSRGLHVAYDLEPYALEDWIILQFGMGRRPLRYDRIADQLPPDGLSRYLVGLKSGIAQSVKAMPPHAVYRQGLVNYLKQQLG